MNEHRRNYDDEPNRDRDAGEVRSSGHQGRQDDNIHQIDDMRRFQAGNDSRLRATDPNSILPELLDDETGWYRAWYYLARVNDELKLMRSLRLPASLIYLEIKEGPHLSPGLEAYLHNTIAVIGHEELRSNDIKARLSAYEFAIFLPYTPEPGARSVVARLENRLQGFTVAMGVASFPRDARSAEKLLQTARHDAQPPPDNVIDFDAFCQRHEKE